MLQERKGGRERKKILLKKIIMYSQALVTHACNPSYSGDGEDQENSGSKLAPGK
jgi:hypothetical protein